MAAMSIERVTVSQCFETLTEIDVMRAHNGSHSTLSMYYNKLYKYFGE